MCGRYTLKTSPDVMMELFHVSSLPDLVPRYNIAPTQNVLVIRASTERPAEREAIWMRWGLIPFWAKDLSIGSQLINARAETVSEKPAFRTAFAKRRCLIAADGFYEWQKLSTGRKQPWWIHQPNETPFAMAGLWETWTERNSEDSALDADQPATPRIITSCTILTTEASNDVRPLHDRMPVILPPDAWQVWLGASASPGQLRDCLKPLSAGSLQMDCVSQAVNRPGPESPDLLTPVPAPEPLTRE
jgi:putative SOS response-associated peptidase YedK